jgi:hypothetical protein
VARTRRRNVPFLLRVDELIHISLRVNYFAAAKQFLAAGLWPRQNGTDLRRNLLHSPLNGNLLC